MLLIARRSGASKRSDAVPRKSSRSRRSCKTYTSVDSGRARRAKTSW
jgi:hypothetical protein